jgi:hypothetical protein
MTLNEMKRMIDTLSAAEKAELREYIDQQRLKAEIDAMLANEPPEPLQAGTLDMDQLRAAADGMWAGLDEDEVTAIVAAMIGKH